MASISRTSVTSPNAGMTMSSFARARMRATEKVMLRYYNDMGKRKGNCTWGIGFYAHKGICGEDELARMVDAASVDIEYAKRIAEAERRIKLKVRVALSQDQFDGLVSFTYNTANVANQPVYDALNGQNFARAAQIMSDSVYVRLKGKKKLASGLVARRAEESAPFHAVKMNAAASSKQEQVHGAH